MSEQKRIKKKIPECMNNAKKQLTQKMIPKNNVLTDLLCVTKPKHVIRKLYIQYITIYLYVYISQIKAYFFMLLQINVYLIASKKL